MENVAEEYVLTVDLASDLAKAVDALLMAQSTGDFNKDVKVNGDCSAMDEYIQLTSDVIVNGQAAQLELAVQRIKPVY
jgi:hypothetical protein